MPTIENKIIPRPDFMCMFIKHMTREDGIIFLFNQTVQKFNTGEKYVNISI